MKKVPLVVGQIKLMADFDGDGKDPGFEMEIKATYRDVQQEALVELEKGVAGIFQRMSHLGDQVAEKNF